MGSGRGMAISSRFSFNLFLLALVILSHMITVARCQEPCVLDACNSYATEGCCKDVDRCIRRTSCATLCGIRDSYGIDNQLIRKCYAVWKFDACKDCPALNLPHLEVSCSFPMTAYAKSRRSFNRKGANVISPHSSASMTLDLLDVYEDEYDGVIIDPECLPSSTYAFVAILRTSLSYWKMKGKKGIWLRILLEQAHLVPVAIKEGFNYHHAEPGYVMLTYWIPKEPCMLPANASHQVGVGGFVITEKSEVLVVKERKCPCRCSGIWKLPTGFIDKSEELFTGAIREVKEETGIETDFLEVIAFRHAHSVAFDKSDLLFFCMLKPLSFDITIDEAEIEDAKWMPLDEFLGQPYYQEDQMLKKAMELCVARYENRYSGFIAHQLISKFDGRLSYLYSND